MKAPALPTPVRLGPTLTATAPGTWTTSDDVGAWQTVEPVIDFTSTAVLADALTVG